MGKNAEVVHRVSERERCVHTPVEARSRAVR